MLPVKETVTQLPVMSANLSEWTNFKFYAVQGKMAFGNKAIETTLCLHFESASGIYTVVQVRLL